jgi:hypothetical protein
MTQNPVIPLLATGAVLALAFILNPLPDRHRQKIREATAQRSPVARVLGLGSLAAFASSYHSLGVASYTTAGERTLSVGALGMVFVLE